MLEASFSRYASLLPTVAGKRTWIWRCAIAFLAYIALAGITLRLPTLGPGIYLAWAPAGVALAASLRWGPQVWPGLGLAAWLAAAESAGDPWLGLSIAAGMTAGPVLGAWALRRDGWHPSIDRPRDLVLLIGIGAGLASLLPAANTAVWMAWSGRIAWAQATEAFFHGWTGHALGTLALAAPILSASHHPARRGPWVPLALMAVVAAAAVFASMAWLPRQHAFAAAIFFVPHVLLCWLGARGGLFVASFTALLLALAVTVGAPPPLPLGVNDPGTAMWLGYVGSLLFMPLLGSALTRDIAGDERRWQLALDGAGIGVCEWALSADRLSFSPRWLKLLGYGDGVPGETMAAFWDLIHPSDLERVRQAFAPLHDPVGANCRAECRLRGADGNWRLLELHAMVLERGAEGAPVRALVTARDFSEIQAARDGQALSRSVFQHLHEGLLITDADHRVVEANPTFCEITGFSRDELLGAVPPLLRAREHEHQLATQLADMRVALATGGTWRGELNVARRGGEPCALQLTGTAVRDANGLLRNHVFAVADVTRVRAQLAQLQRQAHFDELTRLPNRVRLAQMLQTAMETSRREGSLLTVCYLDLDHFKPVNDRFGHEAGDRLLIEVANRMRRSLRSWAGGDDVVARIGGDEFVLLLRTATLEESRHAVERVLGQVCQPYELGANVGAVMVTASIGATVFPLDGADAETLLRHADHAMYGAKQAGRNGYLFFDAEHDRRAEARFVALGRVQEALDANEFHLYFQPKVDMRHAKVLGVEALLRWKHPEQGVISPAQFLPLTENTGLSIAVGNWVLAQGIEQLAQWLRLGLDLTVSINVSARHLQEPLFAQHLAALLSRYQAPVANHLIIEVLETAALADVDYTCELMQECRALGVRFALDDFGTGYSTFTYLKRLPIDLLKIDRSFVINMLGDRQDLAIVEGVIGLSQTFGCTVVAEGVETPAQAQRLIEIGCDIGQGNGIAAAMPAEAVPGWVRDYRGMGAAPVAEHFAAV